MSPRPPRLAEWLLTRFLPHEAREDVLGDLHERFAPRRQERGSLFAGIWYWRQVVGGVMSLSKYKATNTLKASRGPRPSTRNRGFRGGSMFPNLGQEIRHSFRAFGRNPGMTATVLLTIGLAVGANTTVFTMVNSLLLAYPEYIDAPQDLVRVTHTNSRTRAASLSLRDYQRFRDNNTVFSGFAVRSTTPTAVAANRAGASGAVQLSTISWNYFDLLGVPMASGRTFRSDEDQVAGASPVVIISDGLRERFFGDRGDVIGASLPLNGQPFTVVGVLPAGYHGLSAIDTPPDAWIPIMSLTIVQPGAAFLLDVDGPGFDNWLWGVARLQPGVSLGQAVANMDAVAEQYYASVTGATGLGVAVHGDYRFQPPQAAALRRTMRLLTLAAAMVLAVACANIASLLLARATARQSELAVRSALGAGRRRIVQLLVTENLLLAWLGGVVGFAMAFGATGFATALLPVTPTVAPSPDWTVAAYAVLLATIAAIAFGVAPALVASRPDLVSPLRASAGKGGRLLMRSALVVSQAMVSLVLVTAAALFVQSARRALTLDLGFDVEAGAAAGVRLPERYTTAQGKQFMSDIVERLNDHPQIEEVGVAFTLPLGGGWGGSYVANDSPRPPDERQQADFNAVGPGYFRAMDIPILEGRGFSDQDEAGPAVVVVNETLAREIWPNESPIGKSIARDPGGPPFVVVGVARDASYYSVGEEQLAYMYFSNMQQYYRPNFNFIVRAADPAAVLEPMRQFIRALDPDLPVALTTLSARFERQVGGFRVSAIMSGFFAVVALLMTALGLYGTIGFITARRAPEFAIRTAMGATSGAVTGIVLRHGLKLVGIGVVLGALLSVGGSRILRGVLFGIDPGNPGALAMSVIVLLGVAGLASYLPARRAGKVDPAVMLRVE